MKLIIGVAIVVFLVSFGVWKVDIANDRTKNVKITETVLAYNDWECGYQNMPNCSVIFEVMANTTHDVQRIRYGKDFMAIKIHLNGLLGWVFYGKGVKVNAGPNT